VVAAGDQPVRGIAPTDGKALGIDSDTLRPGPNTLHNEIVSQD
jgi:hypothetical protein